LCWYFCLRRLLILIFFEQRYRAIDLLHYYYVTNSMQTSTILYESEKCETSDLWCMARKVSAALSLCLVCWRTSTLLQPLSCSSLAKINWRWRSNTLFLHLYAILGDCRRVKLSSKSWVLDPKMLFGVLIKYEVISFSQPVILYDLFDMRCNCFGTNFSLMELTSALKGQNI
jgi:hypothetical protein